MGHDNIMQDDRVFFRPSPEIRCTFLMCLNRVIQGGFRAQREEDVYLPLPQSVANFLAPKSVFFNAIMGKEIRNCAHCTIPIIDPTEAQLRLLGFL